MLVFGGERGLPEGSSWGTGPPYGAVILQGSNRAERTDCGIGEWVVAASAPLESTGRVKIPTEDNQPCSQKRKKLLTKEKGRFQAPHTAGIKEGTK